MEKARTSDLVSSGLTAKTGSGEKALACGKYYAECRDKDGNLKWVSKGDNLVVNVGLQYMAGTSLVSVAQITTWYVGLYGAAASNTPAASDTMSSHAGWTEIDCYSNATRPAATFAAATNANPSVVTNTSNKAVFNIDASATVGGAFLTSNNTILGSTGTLFSAADFQAPGDRAVVSGDVLSVTYEFRLTAT